MTDNNDSKQHKIRDFLSKSISSDLIDDLANYCSSNTWKHSDLIDDLANYCLSNTWQDSEHLKTYFTDYFDEITSEIFVDYNDAIKYLSKNDISLENSIEVAADLGYDINNIDSCILANKLYQNEQRQELCNINFKELFNLIKQ